MTVLRSSDVADFKAVDAAVEAVKARDRHFRQWILAVGVGMLLALGVQTKVLYDQTQSTQNIAEAQARVQTEVTCALAAETQVTTQYLSKFAKRFGGPLPPVPGLPHDCGGNDPVFVGTSRDDVINGTRGPDWINGEGGNDTLKAHGGGDTIIGYTGNDLLYGGKRVDYLFGGEGNDTLHGGGDRRTDHLDGGRGHDTCYARSNDLTISCETIVRVP